MAGVGNVATWCSPLKNIIKPPHNRYMFLADPIDQWKAEKVIGNNQLTLVAVYHSHPNGGTDLSRFDRECIVGSRLMSVILAFDASQSDVSSVAAYQWTGGSIGRVDVTFD